MTETTQTYTTQATEFPSLIYCFKPIMHMLYFVFQKRKKVLLLQEVTILFAV